jgi:hypothetical protein
MVVFESYDMSYAHPTKSARTPGGDQERIQRIDEEALGFTSQAPLLTNNYHDGLNNFITESWLSDTNQTWSAWQRLWSHDESPPLLPSREGLGEERPFLYTGVEQSALSYNANLAGYDPEDVSRSNERIVCHPQPHVAPSYGAVYHSQTPQESQPVSPSNQHLSFQNTSNVRVPEYTQLNAFNTNLPLDQPSSWLVSYPEPQTFNIAASLLLDPNVSKPPPDKVELDWSNSEQLPSLPSDSRETSYSPPASKRKRKSPRPTSKKSRSETAQKELSEFVMVFENAPGALASVKHRRKLDAPVRKAARDVRKAGACHQCRFRKRTVSVNRSATPGSS